jgi:outer membrane protein TolC
MVSLQTKLRQYYNEWRQLGQQIQLQQQAIASYLQLQRGEEIRFNNGESSLFLINSREQKTIEARQKLIELQSKEQKARVSVLWSAGALQQ